MKKLLILLLCLIPVFLYASGDKEAFHKTAEYVDLERFSGDWYVIALIPTIFEKDAANGIENYSIDEEGKIKVEYTFRKDSPDGKEKIMHQTGRVYNNETNADWRVVPLWPFELPYYILEIDDNYENTVIGTNNYKYLWIMSRKSKMDAQMLSDVIDRMVKRGYNREDIIFMEQRWKE